MNLRAQCLRRVDSRGGGQAYSWGLYELTDRAVWKLVNTSENFSSDVQGKLQFRDVPVLADFSIKHNLNYQDDPGALLSIVARIQMEQENLDAPFGTGGAGPSVHRATVPAGEDRLAS
jgi:hypothetical protein